MSFCTVAFPAVALFAVAVLAPVETPPDGSYLGPCRDNCQPCDNGLVCTQHPVEPDAKWCAAPCESDQDCPPLGDQHIECRLDGVCTMLCYDGMDCPSSLDGTSDAKCIPHEKVEESWCGYGY